MKKLKVLKLTPYLFSVALMTLISWSKEKIAENNESQVTVQKAEVQDPIVEEILWVLDNWENYEGNVNIFINEEDGLGWGFGDNGGPPPATAIVCQGSGISFARCCKDWLEANPEKCLKVTYSGGTFTADDDCEN